jgi:RNA polymerase sigma-70 factor (ECF subfamily)
MEPSDEERELVAALRRGDRNAFDVVYDRYRPRVFAFLARLGGNRAQAEDLLQETFMRLATTARQLPEETNLHAYLFTVARNLFIDQRRRALLDIDRIRDLALWPSRPRWVEETPFDLSEVSQTIVRLENALCRLPTKYREAVLLCSVEGFTPAEAAQVLGDHPDALRQRLSRGRRMLRDALEEP